MDDALLAIQGLSVTYGDSLSALRGVSLTVNRGAVVAVLGSNGAGKTTLLRAVSCALGAHGGRVTAGTILFDGEDLARRDTAWAVRRGLVHVPEGRGIFRDLSVEENLQAGGATVRDSAARRRAHQRVMELFPILADRRRQPAGLLSGGQQQMLAIGRALMTSPRLLLLDEPSLGLAPQLVEQIGQVIARIRSEGTAVMLIEQNAAMGLRVADYAYVLETGHLTSQGPANELAASEEIRERYLGGARPDTADVVDVQDDHRRPGTQDPSAATTQLTDRGSTASGLTVSDLTMTFGGVAALADVSFEVQPGTIHALIGPNGAGKSTCLNVLSGAYRATGGHVRYGEHKISRLPAHRIARLGVARTFQNLSLAPEISVADNILSARDRHMQSGLVSHALRLPRARADERAHGERVREIAQVVGIEHLLHRQTADLSYGDRKRVELARALALEPTLLLLDEPVAGMAQGESMQMAELIRDVQQTSGITVVLVEHDMQFVMSLAHRVTVLDHGRLIADGPPEVVVEDPEVIRAYLGVAA